jgi:hypothetical protein
MTDYQSVHPLKACDLIIGAGSDPPKHRQRKQTLTTALKAARKAGADRVEVVDGKIVIVLAGRPVNSSGNSASSSIPVTNPWDDVLPGGNHGAD